MSDIVFTKDGIFMVNGEKRWLKNHLLHRDNDLPAVEYVNGDREWCEYGRTHRIGNPAIIHENGAEKFYLNDKKYPKEDYWKEIGKIYGLVIRNKEKL